MPQGRDLQTPKKGRAKGTDGKSTNKATPELSSKNVWKDVACSVQDLQKLLDVFRHSFPSVSSPNTKDIIQEVKSHLYHRDFKAAFSREEYLEAYAVRWSAARALCYSEIFKSLFASHPELRSACASAAATIAGPSATSASTAPDATSGSAGGGDRVAPDVFAVGAGAGAELVALAGALYGDADRLARDLGEGSPDAYRDEADVRRLRLRLVDVADWSKVIASLRAGIEGCHGGVGSSAPPAFAALDVSFEVQDVLGLGVDELAAELSGCRLVTIMFTLNELYTTSMSKATKLLLDMTASLAPGALLLVVDSPGSYSTVNVGKGAADSEAKEKKYPMQWLLDHTLLELAATPGEKSWEQVYSNDSKWFRLPRGLAYPINLEDMRYQISLYRRI